MDEPDALSPAQRQVLHAELRRLETELSEAIERSRDEAKPVALETPIGRLSRIDAIAQREISQAGRRQQVQQLGLVRTALASIDDDEFGLCRVCEEPIAFPRLRARPFATICLRCQAPARAETEVIPAPGVSEHRSRRAREPDTVDRMPVPPADPREIRALLPASCQEPRALLP